MMWSSMKGLFAGGRAADHMKTSRVTPAQVLLRVGRADATPATRRRRQVDMLTETG